MLISNEMLKENVRLTESEKLGGGSGGGKWYGFIRKLAVSKDFRSILDYGCGDARFSRTAAKDKAFSGRIITNYDVANPLYPQPPTEYMEDPRHDLVICIDVLEHIEEDYLPSVLENIRKCTGKMILMSVCFEASKRWLQDGRNDHVTIRSPEWWASLFINHGFITTKVVTCPKFKRNHVKYSVLLVPGDKP